MPENPTQNPSREDDENPIYISDFSIILKNLMTEKGITQKALALEAGINETGVRDILKGRSKNPRRDTLIRLSRVLGCDPADLITPPEAVTTDNMTANQAPFPGYQLPGSRMPITRLPILSAISSTEWHQGFTPPFDFFSLPAAHGLIEADCLFLLRSSWGQYAAGSLLLCQTLQPGQQPGPDITKQKALVLRQKETEQYRIAAPRLFPDGAVYAVILGLFGYMPVAD